MKIAHFRLNVPFTIYCLKDLSKGYKIRVKTYILVFWCTPKCTANFNNKIDYDITLASTCICTLILHNSLLFSVICFVFQISNNIVYIEQSLNLFIYLLIIWRLILSSKAVFIRQLLTGSCISTAEKISQ